MSVIYDNRDIPDDLRQYFVRAEIGLEPTPDAYVVKMVEVFREVRRVLRDDGTCWVNLGDSYASQGGKEPPQKKWDREGIHDGMNGGKSRTAPMGLKPKDLIGIPWRVAFALQADGWYLRQDIIWHKPNPMPESVTDRCTKAHEYLFLLTKAERYFYDQDAMREKATHGFRGSDFRIGKTSVHQLNRTSQAERVETETRNRRSVWTIATQPYSGAHFAVMPSALVEPCILAGSRPGDTVLDPFMGSGTTAAVATRLARHAITIDLNPDYHTLATHRITAAQAQPDFFYADH